MATIVIQMGHVPRTRGATGTHREQEFNRAVAPRIEARLRSLGHTVHVIGADIRPPSSDVFVSLHCDGSTNRARHGASVGYVPGDATDQRLAHAWKRAHQRHGYRWGFLPDNYTRNLSGYYAWNSRDSRSTRATYKFLAEHGHTTNPEEEAWLFSNLDQCAQAHVDAIGEVVGHPNTYARPAGLPARDKIVTGVVVPKTSPNSEGFYPTWILDVSGGVFTLHRAKFYGSVPGLGIDLPRAGLRATDIVPTPTGKGYYVLDSGGGVYTFGDAKYEGAVPGLKDAPAYQRGRSYVGLSITPGGYTLVGDDGFEVAFA